MAPRKKKPAKNNQRSPITFKLNRLQEVILGSALLVAGVILLLSFISFFFTWRSDQSQLEVLGDRTTATGNLLSQLGVALSYFFVFNGFGIAAFSLVFLLLITGYKLFTARDVAITLSRKRILQLWFWGLLVMAWLSIALGFFSLKYPLLGGRVGYEFNEFLQDYIGVAGTVLLLAFLLIVYLVIRFQITPEKIAATYRKYFPEQDNHSSSKQNPEHETTSLQEEVVISSPDQIHDTIIAEIDEIGTDTDADTDLDKTITGSQDEAGSAIEMTPKVTSTLEPLSSEDIGMEVEQIIDEEEVIDAKSQKLVENFGEFDPTLELSNFQFPPLDLLKDYSKGKTLTINEEELQANKDRIVKTLSDYKIGIAKISATIGPTVTLYEIVPEAGVRISKIKNLEDDIALSLAALGIRIIAPIPGKGTIGIEVPNQNPSIVSMRSVIASPKFQKAEMALPIAFGKTISNETFVVDLAKMPHMLMAGATGQGKSVGLNAVLTSLLYSKHPAEVKFVLVDPKKVELTLFNKIERHYLAKLPDSEEAIITDNTKVINTLNSLCIEMDQRYDILKEAMCRNIKEYNAKFKARKLNPANGHKFLPYIVLVVDEFADLIMTAGKEVETPIARLAQLARAIGIHLIIATQRPSVNVITGMIKANFPARVSFRVQQKVDSRTILDSGGADQLIGRGDMLYTAGNDIVRIQCAFVDTPEVEKITDFIGAQKAYPDAHLLPEYVGEDGGTSLDNNIDERDSKFREAAEILVIAQQGSASLLQRKLKLGYNRAGRIIDQLEAAGIVGAFEGSKARQVLIPDLSSLEVFFNEEK
ncbi:MAG: DNA translocase FtsK [Nonlabens sp.]